MLAVRLVRPGGARLQASIVRARYRRFSRAITPEGTRTASKTRIAAGIAGEIVVSATEDPWGQKQVWAL
jgi:hypothetical protein